MGIEDLGVCKHEDVSRPRHTFMQNARLCLCESCPTHGWQSYAQRTIRPWTVGGVLAGAILVIADDGKPDDLKDVDKHVIWASDAQLARSIEGHHRARWWEAADAANTAWVTGGRIWLNAMSSSQNSKNNEWKRQIHTRKESPNAFSSP